ncbi:MAG: phosphatidate cytidylyltransferase, partial [Prevotella sp.]|nr:phosphatidate cytidylyltransferase [Prevotella sp.]
MTEKQKNLITRSITGTLFVAIIVTCFLDATAMLALFTLATGMTAYEYCTLINEHTPYQVNRFITTVASAYFVIAMGGWCTGLTPAVAFVPYLLTIIYLFVSELYTKAENPISNLAYTMLSQMYIALPFSMIPVLAFMSSADGEPRYNYLLPLSVFIFLWVNDSGAYCFGSMYG